MLALTLLLLLPGAELAGCTPAPPVRSAAPRDTGTATIYVINGGWHTEIALDVGTIEGKLASLEPRFAGARYLVFGWGARGYYMAPNPGIDALLRAMAPGPSVTLVIPLAVSPVVFAGRADVYALRVSRAGEAQLSRFLWDELARDEDGAARPIAAGPYRQSLFYAARGTYDSIHTCNTWTALALRAAGVPVQAAGVVFARQILDQVAPLAVPARMSLPPGSVQQPSRAPATRE